MSLGECWEPPPEDIKDIVGGSLHSPYRVYHNGVILLTFYASSLGQPQRLYQYYGLVVEEYKLGIQYGGHFIQ